VLTAPFSYLEDYRDQYFSPEARVAFRQLAERLYRPVLERTAGSANSEDRLLNYQLSRFMAEAAADPAARAALRDRAHAFTGFGVGRDPDVLPSDLYKSALVVAIQDSGPEFLPHLVAFREEFDDPRFEAASASAIGAVTNPDLIDEVHDLALGEALGPRETFDLIEEAMAEETIRAEHWGWLRDNFAAVVDRIPAQWRRRTPKFAENFCSNEKLAELEALFARHGDLVAGHQRNLAQTKEQIGLCAALADRGQALGAAITNLDTD